MNDDSEAERLLTGLLWAMFPRKDSLETGPEDDATSQHLARTIIEQLFGLGFKIMKVGA